MVLAADGSFICCSSQVRCEVIDAPEAQHPGEGGTAFSDVDNLSMLLIGGSSVILETQCLSSEAIKERERRANGCHTPVEASAPAEQSCKSSRPVVGLSEVFPDKSDVHDDAVHCATRILCFSVPQK